MTRAQGFTVLIEEFRFGRHRGIGWKSATRLSGRIGSLVGMIFNGTFVPVIPLLQKTLKRMEATLRTCDAHQNHSAEKQWHLNILRSSCQ